MSEKSIRDSLQVRSGNLANYRRLINQAKGLAAIVGSAVQVQFVLDANVIFHDLIWLSSKRKNPAAKTALMEAIEAGTIIACIPPFALTEIYGKIPEVAVRRKVDQEALYKVWGEYSSLLRVESPDPERVEALRSGRDPKDADYIALAETINAHGILSYDKDIPAMGGVVISMEVVGHLMNYSRAAAIEFNIKISGVFLMSISMELFKAAMDVLGCFAAQIQRLPRWAKAALIVLVVFLMLNDNSRARIHGALSSFWDSLTGLAPGALALLQEIGAEHVINKDRAGEFLEKALGLIPDANR